MSTDDSHNPHKDKHDEKYESTVLDFLDKEIAAAQPLQDQNTQADDLDALVSDLMKQVITESDQLQESPEVPDQLISGPPPEQSKAVREAVRESREKAPVIPAAASAASKQSEVDRETVRESQSRAPVTPAAASAASRQSGVDRETVRESQSKTPVTPAAAFAEPKKSKPGRPAEKPLVVREPVLSIPHAKPRWMIPAIALASLCLLASIGVVIHYSGSPGKAPAPQPVSTSPAVSVPAPGVTQAKPQTVAPPVPVQETPAPLSDQTAQAASSAKPLQPETKPVLDQKPVSPAKTPEISVPVPIPAVPNKSAESKAVPAEKPRPDNPPAAVVPASVALAEPQIVVAPVPAPAAPETTSLIIASTDRTPEKPLTPISSQVESFASPIVPASPNARAMIPSTPISQTSPTYPELAVRTRVSGSVVLDLDIDAQGKVVKATPVSGPAVLYSAAVNAALKWLYKPASIGGTNVPSQSRVTMVFNLKK